MKEGKVSQSSPNTVQPSTQSTHSAGPVDIVRGCVFTPYRKGSGPRFRLTIWDTHRYTDYLHSSGKHLLGYRLTRMEPGTILTVFEGEDFGCSPIHAIDSDECVASLMSFLTLQPGDTDAEYFANYTADQLAFCEEHAEALAMEVMNRFGDR